LYRQLLTELYVSVGRPIGQFYLQLNPMSVRSILCELLLTYDYRNLLTHWSARLVVYTTSVGVTVWSVDFGRNRIPWK